MYLLTPIALGSLWAFPIFSLNIPLLVWRIFNEEKVLLRDLPDYYEYCQKKRYRLLPLIW
jgi:protein-S-isoprenylcysteine O-methyltransferase Ste14